MEAHHITNAHALQSYFVSRMQAIVKRHGKQLIAWEEAYSPDGPEASIYQVWSPFAESDLLKLPMHRDEKLIVSRGFYLDWFLPARAYYLNDALPVGGGVAMNQAPLGGEAAM